MRESLIGSVLNTLTGGDTTTTTPTPTTATTSPTTKTPTATTKTPTSTTKTPTSTTKTPTTTTQTPTITTSTPSTTTSAPASITATPSSTSSPASSASHAADGSENSGSGSGSAASASGASETPGVTADTNATSIDSVSSSSGQEERASFATSSSDDIDNNDSNTGESWSQSSSTAAQLTDNDSASQDVDGLASEQQGTSIGLIIGVTLAVVVALLLIVGLGIWWRRRKKRTARESRSPSLQQHFAAVPAKLSDDTANSRIDTSSTELYTSLNTHNLENGGYSASLGKGGMWEDETITAMRIPLEKLSMGKLLNRGGYGEVYRGSYRGEAVAIKMLLPETRKDLRQINSFLSEIKMMSAMEHPRVVRFIGVAWDSLSDLCSVTELMEGGDLRSLLDHFERKERRPHGFDREKARIALHVAHSLTYLHSLDPLVLHRDLKSKNILLTEDLGAKITDFGVSRESSDRTMTAGVGTSLWMAPEVMMGERYDSSADIFSFGIVLSELDSHVLPYAAAKETASGRVIPDTALLQLVSLGRLQVEFSHNAPQSLVDLGLACVELDPTARPNAGEVLYQLQLILQMYEAFTL